MRCAQELQNLVTMSDKSEVWSGGLFMVLREWRLDVCERTGVREC